MLQHTREGGEVEREIARRLKSEAEAGDGAQRAFYTVLRSMDFFLLVVLSH